MDFIRSIFGENIIYGDSKPVAQTPDSPDFSILDNCLWHDLKSKKIILRARIQKNQNAGLTAM